VASPLTHERKNLQTNLEDDALHRTGGTTMSLLDILTSVIMLGTAYLLLFTALVQGVGRIDEPAP
jgi:hypothetical protein